MSLTRLLDEFYDPNFMFSPRHSVYVITEEALAEYKQKQMEDEVAQLQQLIDGHKRSIEQLETSIKAIKKEAKK